MPLRQRPARRTRVDQNVGGPPVVEEDHYVPPRRPPLPQIWPWLLLLLLLVIGGLVAAYFLTRDNDHKNGSASAVSVPAVVGLKQSNAVRRLDDQGLVPQLGTKPSSFPAGTVFAQDPGAGTQVSRGSLVKLSVSAAAQIAVPNVVGMRTSAAVSQLKAAGLQSQVTAVPAKAAPGVVVKASPVAGTKVAKGSTVSLQVSKGETTVPDVRGQPAADAKAVLQTAGLTPVEFKVPSAQPKGTVTAQKPVPNKKVPRGSKVRINVSTGTASSPGVTTTGGTTSASQTVRVPKVVGLQQTVAQRRLHSAGLGSQVKYVSSRMPSGQVVAESPTAGTTVRKGSKVQISVSLGPSATTTQVPNVVGQDQQTATNKLQGAGFQVQVITVPTSDPSQNGTVVDEEPAGGTRAPDGSTVTIYVGSSG
jgi:eukaryotic-like serine/threonine-protein kinase